MLPAKCTREHKSRAIKKKFSFIGKISILLQHFPLNCLALKTNLFIGLGMKLLTKQSLMPSTLSSKRAMIFVPFMFVIYNFIRVIISCCIKKEVSDIEKLRITCNIPGKEHSSCIQKLNIKWLCCGANVIKNSQDLFQPCPSSLNVLQQKLELLIEVSSSIEISALQNDVNKKLVRTIQTIRKFFISLIWCRQQINIHGETQFGQ